MSSAIDERAERKIRETYLFQNFYRHIDIPHYFLNENLRQI